MTRCRWVDSRRAEGFPVAAACSAAGISTTTFYEWACRGRTGPSGRDLCEAYLVNEIVDIHGGSDGTYGVPRVHAELTRHGAVVNRKRVRRLMRQNSIVGVYKGAKVRTTIPAEDNPPIPDLVGRRFAPGCPDAAWVGDITYIPTGEGWLYLASALDLGSRRLLGYSMAEHMRTDLVIDALDMAVGVRGGDVAGVIFHGDRGAQYMSARYQQHLADLGMRQSVGRTGVCWDNSVAEALWSGLKRELVHRYRFATRSQARQAIFRWINWYNRSRLHSSLGYLPPVEWEAQYRRHQPAAGRQAA
ncbi:MAG: IS3 family transposase [Actinomycetes bacterium]